MKFIAFLALTASLYAAPISAPSMDVDGQEVVSPNIGKPVIPVGDFSLYTACLNDNPADAPNNDHDYNDACATASFGADNVLTLTYDGGLSASSNFIGVRGQTGSVGPGVLEWLFTYTPGVETIFAGYVNGTNTYYSGSMGSSNNPPGDYFYTECLACLGDGRDPGGDVVTPEPAGIVLVGLGLGCLALRRFIPSN